jgi:diaminohydroxyphosphoribosylaminopyrimidine deaminase/5-amino-6-(5-phosphoribosylamino)uracil reductase
MSKGEEELYMMECLLLADKGGGYVSPNPLVGALVVKKGRVIGRGYHAHFGGPHAEVNAIRKCSVSPRGATLVVNLEPCNHRGKTGPCTELIMKSGITRVVVGMPDPNPLVRGKGIAALRRAGVRVDVGVMRDACEKINERFAKFITQQIPFVAVKVAQSLDGKIAGGPGDPRWITTLSSRKIVHHLRSRYDAVLVGAGTVVADNPSLTVRHVKGRDPLRIVLDGRLRTSAASKVYETKRGERTIVVTTDRAAAASSAKVRAFAARGVEILPMVGNSRGFIPPKSILRALARLPVASVFIEGGGQVFAEFLNAGVVDKCYWFIAPRTLGKGRGTSSRNTIDSRVALRRITHWNIDGDLLIEGYVD